MKTDPRVAGHLHELVKLGNEVIHSSSDSGLPILVDRQLFASWTVSCLSYLAQIWGKQSEYYSAYKKCLSSSCDRYTCQQALGILISAESDYSNGNVFDLSKRIRAETFEDFLEHAEYFLSEGYYQVAIVTAGAVLENTLRKMCEVNNIQLLDKPKLDKMNADLAKAGVYDALIQKKITWLADLRNKAAHGKWETLKKEDAEEMIKATRRFVEDYAA